MGRLQVKLKILLFAGARCDLGSLADYAVCDVNRLAHKPASLSFSQAAALPIAYLTGLQGFKLGGLKAGDKVLVIGASGGCGIAALQLAKALGASDIVGVCSGSNAAVALAHGAHRVIDYKATSLVEAHSSFDLKSELNPFPIENKASRDYFDIVYDAASGSGAGEDYFDSAVAVLKPGGKHIYINGPVGKWLAYFTNWEGESGKMVSCNNQSRADLEHLGAFAAFICYCEN